MIAHRLGRAIGRLPARRLIMLAGIGAGIGVGLGLGFGAMSGCGGTPWFLGRPLDDRQVVPPTTRAETVAVHRRHYEEARRRGEKVIELAELAALEQRGALHDEDVRRFVELLKERGRDWVVLRRPLPLAEDLRHVVALDPGRARGLATALRNAERAAGDVWLAVGENARAEEEYRRADRLGATGMLFRLRAAWGASPADLDRPVLELALAQLPERVLAPFTAAYLDADGEPETRLLQRAWGASRVYGPPQLLARLEALPQAVTFVAAGAVAAGAAPPPPSSIAATPGAPPAAQPKEPARDARLYEGPTLARTLLPLARLFPQLSAPGERSREWADRLLAEDPTAPDSLEFAALVDARAGRLDGAARKLLDLVFYSTDRSAGHARAARVWEQTGEGRRACLSWERAVHFGPVDDPRWCNLVACLRDNPGAGDHEQVRRHLHARAPQVRCPGYDAAGLPSTDAGVTGEDAANPGGTAAAPSAADATAPPD